MIPSSALLSALLVTASPAAVKSGKASVEWIAVSSTCEPGKPLQTAIRMVLDENWHTYWENPGEGGMKTSIEWELPPGWSAGELEHPVPKRFMTGGLAGFGYEGTVIFPVTITPPAEFTGEANLMAKVSWLTCNDDSCVPGNAVLTLAVKSGKPIPTAETEDIQKSLKLIPKESAALNLDVVEAGDKLQLTLRLADGADLDPAASTVFPATPEVIDPGAEIRFVRDGDSWTAEVPKSEYSAGPVRSVKLVLTGKGSAAPIAVSWVKK